ELQYPHSRKIESIAKLCNLWSDRSQVLGNDGQPSEPLCHRRKKLHSRHVDPFPVRCCLVFAGHLPRSDEPTKMINADYVDRLEHLSHPLDPPCEAVDLHRGPIVYRIAPPLPGL